MPCVPPTTRLAVGDGIFFHSLKVVAMIPFVPSVAALTVSTIYCFWQAYRRQLLHRQRTLRERVAFMLWTAANRES